MFGFGGGDKKQAQAAAGGGDAGAAAEGGDAAGGAPPVDDKKVGAMPSGDYSIHVHLQTGKNFLLPEEDTVDPYIQIEVLGRTKTSNTKNDVTIDTKVNFNEHIFMDLKKMDNEEVEEATMMITVLNKGFFKGDIIGQIQLSLSKIYHMKNHVMMHQRLGLANPNGDDFSKMTGNLVLSINVQGPGDEATELKMGTAAEIEKSPIIMPSSVQKKYKQLYLRIYQATNLPKMDFQLVGTGSIDAFLKLQYKGKTLKTTVIRQEDNLVPWMQEFLIPVEVPVVNNKLVMQLYDQDNLTNELAATTELAIKSMIKYDHSNPNLKSKSQCKWINLYGAPTGRSGSNTDKMNKSPEEASNWKGRIAVEYWCVDHKYPEFKVQPIPADFDSRNFERTIAPNRFLIIGEFGQGMCLPTQEKYRLKFALADMVIESNKPKNQKLDFCRWDERFGGEVFEMPYSEGKQMPSFYIYLVNEDNVEVCFFRDTLLSYRDPNGPIQWRSFEPDKSHGYVTNEQLAGFFSFRLYFHEIDRQGPFDPMQVPVWKKGPPTRQTPYRARVAIYQCENLPPADEQGHSDPYIQVYDPNNAEIKTEVCPDTNNPIFYEVKEFTFSCNNVKGEIDLLTAPPVILNIFDHDDGMIDSTDDLIGRAVIHLMEATNTDDGIKHISFDDEIPYPAWYPVKRHYDDEYDLETGASILASIQIIPLDEEFSVPAEDIVLNEEPPRVGNQILKMPNLQMEEFKCEIIALGLRDLVSTGLMSVNKPYIKFALKSLLPANQASAVDNIFTQPNARGANPTIRTTVQFEVKMPDDPTFLPRMTCEVFDQLFMGGASQPSIGTFTLKFGDCVQDMREKVESDYQTAVKLTRAVEKVKNKIKGLPLDQRQRAAEICGSLSSAHGDNISAVSPEEKLGLALLKKLDAEGLSLPTSNAMKKKGGGKKGRTVNLSQADKKPNTPSPFMKNNTTDQLGDISQKSNKEQSEEITRAVGGNVRRKVQIAFEADLAAKKRELEMARKDDQAAVAARPGAFGNKVMPLYKYDERLRIDREVDPPPSSIFKAIGYNKNPQDEVKHYRRYYPDELENVKDKYGIPIINSPFIKELIYRSKPVKQGGFLGNLFSGDGGAEYVSINVGYFKGTIRCYNEKIRGQAEQRLKNQLQKLMDNVIQVYEIEQQGQKCPLGSGVVQNLDKLESSASETTLKQIRNVIEDAGLEKLNIFPLIDDISFQGQLLKKLNEVQECKVSLYVIEGFNFAQRDLFSASDPYLKIHCGSKTFNERENYQLDTSEPKFFKCYQFQVKFPGSPSLVIEAYDYDSFFGDDLIGITKIDLDDRFYSQSWLAIEDKPIEYRDLFEDSSTITQGVVKLWVEIHDVDSAEASMPPLCIDSEPVQDFECRVVIWKTRDIEMMDVEGTSDVFIRAFFDDQDDHTTDTHWRCQNGQASFNYRLLLPIKSQRAEGYTLNIQAWDKDIIASNDLIGSCALPIDYLFEDAVLTDQPKYINVRYFNEHMKDQLRQMSSPLADDIEFDSEEKDRFWVPIHRLVQEEGKTIQAGEILMSVSIIPKKAAEKNPQGKARQEPNTDPHCPPPEGRASLSLNPITMFNQMVGPAVRRKIFMMLLCVACAFLCAMMAPMIFSNIITKMIIG